MYILLISNYSLHIYYIFSRSQFKFEQFGYIGLALNRFSSCLISSVCVCVFQRSGSKMDPKKVLHKPVASMLVLVHSVIKQKRETTNTKRL